MRYGHVCDVCREKDPSVLLDKALERVWNEGALPRPEDVVYFSGKLPERRSGEQRCACGHARWAHKGLGACLARFCPCGTVRWPRRRQGERKVTR